MTLRRLRFPVKTLATLMAIACLLAFDLGAVSLVLAADPPPAGTTWETWPKAPPGAVKAGETAGAKTATGISAGTWGWVAGGVAVAAGVAIAAGGGSSSSSAPPVCPQ